MYREKLQGPAVGACRHRTGVRRERDEEFANCELVNEITGLSGGLAGAVPLAACEACCRSFPPSVDRMNPVTASLVFTATSRIIERGGVPGRDVKSLELVRTRAINQLDLLYSDPIASPEGSRGNAHDRVPLERIVPPPVRSGNSSTLRWAVGVTTAPRRRATLEVCLDSLMRAGWSDVHLFIDGGSIPDRFHQLPGTYRDRTIGAWPNYFLAMSELLMRRPDADAVMILEDDSLFHSGEDVRSYIESMLWPGERPCLLSLYCPAPYTRALPGWGPLNERWLWGALAFVFPRDLAKQLLIDRDVFEHRWNPDGTGLVCTDDVIGLWAERSGIPIWYPTPSLVQHIGETSTLWSFDSRATGVRKAAWFAGDATAVKRPSRSNP